ncbi:hypothetical protein BDR26DRAFT_854058 [Obelidium mucronatum]|nr:hypothetical protein BDR26DRAFT_854058 [Obelidium mucronatum]
MAFGTPQGAITKDAIQYFASNEADLPVYSTLSKLPDVVQYCTVKEFHDGFQATVHIENQDPSPLRVVIPFAVQSKASPYAAYISGSFYANSISGQFLVPRTEMENGLRALLSLKVTPATTYPTMPQFHKYSVFNNHLQLKHMMWPNNKKKNVPMGYGFEEDEDGRKFIPLVDVTDGFSVESWESNELIFEDLKAGDELLASCVVLMNGSGWEFKPVSLALTHSPVLPSFVQQPKAVYKLKQ